MIQTERMADGTTGGEDAQGRRYDVRPSQPGIVRPGATRNDEAARYLAAEMACLANTPARAR